MLSALIWWRKHNRRVRELRSTWSLLREARIAGDSLMPYWVDWWSDYHRIRWLVAIRFHGGAS